MFQEILQLNIFSFILVFARIGAAFVVLPGFSGMQVPVQSRLAIAVMLSFLITPLLVPQMPPVPGEPMMVFALVATEIVTGLILGTVPLILISAVHVAGTMISFLSGIASALTFDPVVQTQSGIVSGFLGMVAILLIFVTDMHQVFIRALIDSYSVFHPAFLPDIGDTTQMITRQVSQTFRIGVEMSAPFIILNFAYNVGLGIISRLAPQVPIFFVAMPLQLVVSLLIMMVTTSGIMLVSMNYLAEGMRPFLNP